MKPYKKNKINKNINKSIHIKKQKRNTISFRYLPYIVLSIIILLVVVIRIKFIGIPFERDEGDYCYIGQLILKGEIPYLSFYEQKFPGLFYIYAFMIMLFGHTPEGIHFGFIFINIFTIVLVYFIIKHLFDDFSGLVSAASFSLLSLTPKASGFTIQSEHLIAFFSCLGFYFLVRGILFNKKRLLILCGFFMGFAFLIKPNAVFYIIFSGSAIILYYLANKKYSLYSIINPLIFYSLGVLLPIIIIVLITLLQGAFSEMLYWTFKFASNYVSEISISQGLIFLKDNFQSITLEYLFLWIFGGIGFILILFFNIPKTYKIGSLLLLILSFLTVVPGLRFYGHYWLQFFPSLSFFIGAAYYIFRDWTKKLSYPNLGIFIFAFIYLSLFISHLQHNKNYYFNPNYMKILRHVYGMNPFPESKVIGDFIKKNTLPTDKIVVLGSEPQIYFYADRRCASRHHYISFLMGDTLVFKDNKKMQEEFIHDIITQQPKFIVYFYHPISWLAQPSSDQTIFRWINQSLYKQYKIAGIIDMISMYDTKLIWGNEIQNYKNQGQYFIHIMEIKK